MPLNNRLDFVKDSLFVRYRASEEPQDLDIEVRTSGRYGGLGGGASRLVNVIHAIKWGASGGAHFAPWIGDVEAVTGGPDVAGPGSEGPLFRWSIRVKGVGPRYIRAMVEDLRLVGRESTHVTSMSIQGTLPLDDTDLSVNETTIKGWLEDDTSYPEQWPTPGFPVKEAFSKGKGAALRIEVDGGVPPAIRSKLDDVASAYITSLFPYLSVGGAPSVIRHIVPICASAGSEYRFAIPIFPWVQRPAFHLLVNMLARFHHDVAPIVGAEVGV